MSLIHAHGTHTPRREKEREREREREAISLDRRAFYTYVLTIGLANTKKSSPLFRLDSFPSDLTCEQSARRIEKCPGI